MLADGRRGGDAAADGFFHARFPVFALTANMTPELFVK